MKIINLFFLVTYCFAITNCAYKQSLAKKISSIEGQWQLVAWYNDRPIDINGDGHASIDLYKQWDNCYKHSTLVLEQNPDYYYDALLVYTGKDNPINCPDLKNNHISILQSRKYLPEENTLNFIYKYYIDTYNVITLNDSILVLESPNLLSYNNKEPTKYTGGYIRFKRIRAEKRLNISALLEEQGFIPYLTISGVTQSVTQIKEGYVIKVKTYEDVIYDATIIKDILVPNSLYQTFEVGDKVILKGEIREEQGENKMLVKIIYPASK